MTLSLPIAANDDAHPVIAQMKRVEAALAVRDAMEWLDLTADTSEFEDRYFAVREEAVELSRIAYAHGLDLHLIARALMELPDRLARSGQ